MRFFRNHNGKVHGYSEQQAPLIDAAQLAGWAEVSEWPPVLPDPVPSKVTMRQARLALLGAGLLAQVDAAVASAGDAAQIEWEYALSVDRESPLVASLTAALNLTPEQLDALFTQAAAL